MLRRILVLSVLLVGCGSVKGADSPPTTLVTMRTVPPVTVPETTVVIPTTTTTVPVTTTTEVDWIGVAETYALQTDMARATYGRCGEWHDLAMSVGWHEEEWATLSTVLFTESRCEVNAWNGHDAGLTQINKIHTAWAKEMGFAFPTDLFNPANNLYFAYRLYSSREEKGLCGWKPWTEPCTN
jgi:hypothetical protein